jgi:hypothetical protein
MSVPQILRHGLKLFEIIQNYLLVWNDVCSFSLQLTCNFIRTAILMIVKNDVTDVEIILWQVPHMIVQITNYLTNALITNTSLIL